jgi:hypothetical protein
LVGGRPTAGKAAHAYGHQEIRGSQQVRELTRRRRFVDGGVIVAPAERLPKSLDATYEALFDHSLPWSWFLSLLLTDTDDMTGLVPARLNAAAMSGVSYSPVGLVSGDLTTAQAVVDALTERNLLPFPVLPSRTIAIRLLASAEIDRVPDNTLA